MKLSRLSGVVCACATGLILSSTGYADIVATNSWAGGAGLSTLTFDEANVPYWDEVTDQYQPYGVTFAANEINLVVQDDASSFGLATLQGGFLRISDLAFSIEGLQFDIFFTEVQSAAVFNMEEAYGYVEITSLLNGEIVESFDMLTSYNTGMFYGFENSAFDQIHVTLQGAGGDAFIDNLQYNVLAPIPLPATVWLFVSGLLGLAGMSRRRKAL